MPTKPLTTIAALLLAAARLRAQSVDDVHLPTYDTRYYTIHTDLSGDSLREAQLRMTKMAEEYRARTRGFFGAADQKLPFYLFRKPQDYYATGVPEESAGVFTGTALLALAGETTDLQTWHTIQHEGFHQFAHAAIGGNLPIWLNEGMAEYFGEGLFTGDSFVTGLIPAWRLERVQDSLKAADFVPLKDMMNLPAEQWNAKLSINNYDQAWSMVQFLAHADNGRYERPFVSFLSDVGRGTQWQTAWRKHLGDIAPFEARWKSYWSSLPPNPTANQYGQVDVQILTSFLARATAQHQTFTSFDDFAAALKSKKLQLPDADWLPPSLAKDGLGLAKSLGTTSIEPGTLGRPPRLVLTLKDGTRIVGTFTLKRDGRVDQVRATLDTSRRSPSKN